AATAPRNLSIIPALTSEIRTMLTLPAQPDDIAGAADCCAAACWGANAGLSGIASVEIATIQRAKCISIPPGDFLFWSRGRVRLYHGFTSHATNFVAAHLREP